MNLKTVRYLIEESCEHGRFGKHVTDHDPAGDTYCLTKPVVLSSASTLTLSSLFIVCPHGRRSAHNYEYIALSPDASLEKWCPGGRPATLEDLEGEKVWWCEEHEASGSTVACDVRHKSASSCRMVERILLPLPQMVAGESL